MESNTSKIQKFMNIERGRLKNQLYFNMVKYAYAFFSLAFLIFYLHVSMLTAGLLALSIALTYIRFIYFQKMEQETEILALEIGMQFLLLDCAKHDYQVNFAKIDSLQIKPDDKIKNYNLLMRLKKGEEIEWPKYLREGYYLKIPGVFDEDLFYIINQSLTLSKLCTNYDEAKSFLEYEQDLRFMED